VNIEEALDIARGVPGWMCDDELRWLGERAAKHKIIFEIGSWQGRSTKMMALMTEGVIYSVDNLVGEGGTPIEDLDAAFRVNLAPEIEADKVRIVRESSVEAAKAYYDGFADMVFIDGDHSYEGAKGDFEAWLEVLEVGGLICGHDRMHPGVQQMLGELRPNFIAGPGAIWESERTGVDRQRSMEAHPEWWDRR
jgi:predicted O-methyltransferase YrrM